MSHQEEKISKFLDYPYDSFLMLRLEFMLIFNDELTAKILRIIEKNVETERKHIYRKTVNKMGSVPTEVVEITTDIWVSISYKTFMTDLFGTVNSENTLKRAIKELERMKVIFRRHEPKKKYDAPQYKIHQSVLQMLLGVLKIPGYQSLIPSIFEALKVLPPQELTPSECQNLIPSTENLSTNTKSRVSNFDPTYNNSNNKDNDNKDTYSENVASANSHASTPLSLEDQLEAARQLLQAHGQYPQEQSTSEFSTPTEELSPESVDKSGQTDNDPSVPPQASEQSYSREATHNSSGNNGVGTPTSEKPKRVRKPKAKVDLDCVEPLPPPARPDESIVWSARKILLWGDFFRGYALEPSESSNSTYMKNEKAAIQLFQRGNITEKKFVSVFRYMRGKKIVEGRLEDDLAFRDKWWVENVSADVYHVGKHFDDIVAKIKSNGGKDSKSQSNVQQQLEIAAEGFEMKSQSELMKMQPEKRKEYGRELNAFLAMKKEVDKQNAQAEQASSQKAG